MNISIKRLADSAKSAVPNISKPEYILLPKETLIDTIQYSWKDVDYCAITNIGQSHGLRIVIKHKRDTITDRISYPVNDRLGRRVIPTDEIEGFICDTIVIIE
jgi:hypothetical protein